MIGLNIRPNDDLILTIWPILFLFVLVVCASRTDAPRLCPGLFAPLVELQASFRKEILGEVWWVGADAKREKANKAGRSPIEVYRKGGKFIRKSRRRKKAKVTNVAKTIKVRDVIDTWIL